MKKIVKTILLLFFLSFIYPSFLRSNFISEYDINYRFLKSISSIKTSQWSSEITLTVGNHPVCVSVGDINNDGFNDIITTNQADNTISIFLWNSTYFDWNPEITKDVGYSPESVSIGDANNDGLNDMAISSLDNIVTLFLWNTSSKNWDKFMKTVGDDPECVIIGDANNDGQNDIITANMGDYDISILLWNTTIKDWTPQIRKHTGYVPYNAFLGDVNNDGFNDIITANYGIDNNMSIFLWNSTSKSWDDRMTKYAGNFPFCVFVEDTNNNGLNDMVVSSLDGTAFIYCWNDTIKNWNKPLIRTIGTSPRSIFIQDVNNDNYNDIVSANYHDDNVSILLWNNLIGDWNDIFTISVGREPLFIFVEDVNNDGSNDIITANSDDNSISILLSNTSQLDTPYLETISPNPDVDGIINLNWSDISEADNYIIYRNENYISQTSGLTPLVVVNQSMYNDTIELNGVYYYVIVALNSTAISPISNCESVVVSIPLDAPSLDPIFPTISIDGMIDLNWNNILGARVYYIYRDNTIITDSEEASLIAQTTESTFLDTILVNGIYYYVVIAGDFLSNSSISNCVEVTVEFQTSNSISTDPSFFVVFTLFVLITVVVVKSKYNRKSSI
ncbi:MAG: FG-GAP-like repeat-containing protein [Promethearchaeota archaeon]